MPNLSRILWRVALMAALALSPYLFSTEPPEICASQTAIGVPDWVRTSTIYEINVRQYSDAGTFAAVQADLPRIQELGVDVLWLMPIHPIGQHNRKGPVMYAV